MIKENYDRNIIDHYNQFSKLIITRDPDEGKNRGLAMRVPGLRAEATYAYAQKPQIPLT